MFKSPKEVQSSTPPPTGGDAFKPSTPPMSIPKAEETLLPKETDFFEKSRLLYRESINSGNWKHFSKQYNKLEGEALSGGDERTEGVANAARPS